MGTKAARWQRSPYAADDGCVNVVVETPKGSRNKIKFDDDLDCFRLSDVLPAGNTFPYDFGFLPGTRAEDGDPIDVLLLMDESTFPGTLVISRLVGVIEGEQTEDGRTVRNDRLIAVSVDARDYRDVHSVKDVSSHLIRELEHFFRSYAEMEGRKFRFRGLRGPRHAMKLVKRARLSRRR
ncbi:MAG TPA: inorganic diphosphatase [Myxococcota bacterium]|nr:inorganic diphosphatase [Myxococcota bacterium]